MRREATILVAILLLFALVQMPVSAHSESDPLIAELIAGKNTTVGSVQVWNDDAYLYVKYVTVDAWYMKETHLEVATNPEFIPQKNGNPIPGQFTYGLGHEPAVQCYQYAINLEGWERGTCLSIAAHAEVIHIDSGCLLSVSDDTVHWFDGCDWLPSALCWTHTSWPTISGANWIWRTEYTDPALEYATVPEDGWSFKDEFYLPETAHNIQGSLDITADNAYTISVNEISVGGDGAMNKDGPDFQEWSSVETYIIDDKLGPGLNVVSVNATNYFSHGTYASNPAGLIFKTEVCYDYIDQEETAWAAGSDFPGKNWATFFTYAVQGWNLEGGWVLRFVLGGNYDHDMTVTIQDADGCFEGTGGYPAGGSYSHPWTVTGNVDGNAVAFVIVYGSGAPNPGYTVWATGTIAADGSMSGTWSSSIGQNGDWMSLSGAAIWTS